MKFVSKYWKWLFYKLKFSNISGGGLAPDPLETAPLKVLEPPLDLRLQPLEISYAQQFFNLNISETEKTATISLQVKARLLKRLCDDHLRQRARTYGFRPDKKKNLFSDPTRPEKCSDLFFYIFYFVKHNFSGVY